MFLSLSKWVAVVGRCVFSEPDVIDKFIDVGGDVAYLQEAASDVYTARGWIFGFGFCFSTVSILVFYKSLFVQLVRRGSWSCSFPGPPRDSCTLSYLVEGQNEIAWLRDRKMGAMTASLLSRRQRAETTSTPV